MRMTSAIVALVLVLASGATGWWMGRGSSPMGTSPTGTSPTGSGAAEAKQPEPLYWVAPMDPSYRSDRPGKSPMGMDLVPVYPDQENAQPAGTVQVSPDVQHNLAVRIAPVTRGALEVPIRSVGFIQFDEARVSHIHSRVDGWIQSLSVHDAGEPVRAGQVLFTLYSPTLVKAQEEYLLSRSDVGPSLRRASRDRLLALGMSETQIANLERTGVADERVPIIADRDGVVARLNVREGMFVTPNLEVMAIGGLDRVWLTVELFERESVFVEEEQSVVLRLDYLPGREWRTRVEYVYPLLDAATRTTRVRMELDNADGVLKPGMFGEVTILARSAREALTVPREALIRGVPVDRVVRALGGGLFRSTPVEVGREAGDRVEILGGVDAGDQVVTSGQFLIDSESSRDAELRRMDAGGAMRRDPVGEDSASGDHVEHAGHRDRVDDGAAHGDGAAGHD